MEQQKYQPIAYTDFKQFDEKMSKCNVEKNADRKLVPETLEACVMRVSDIIAYLGKDRQDAQKVVLFEKEPAYRRGKLGVHNEEIINNMIVDIVENSYGKDYIKMYKEFFGTFSEGKLENYKIIYGNEKIRRKRYDSIRKISSIL